MVYLNAYKDCAKDYFWLFSMNAEIKAQQKIVSPEEAEDWLRRSSL